MYISEETPPPLGVEMLKVRDPFDGLLGPVGGSLGEVRGCPGALLGASLSSHGGQKHHWEALA